MALSQELWLSLTAKGPDILWQPKNEKLSRDMLKDKTVRAGSKV